MASKTGFCVESGIYYSKKEPVPLPPPHQHLNLTTYVFSHHSHHNKDIAFIDAPTGAYLTYAALRHNVNALASGLHRLGIRKRDVVLVISPNSIHIPYIYLAILSIGAILTTANPLNTDAEIRKQVKDSNPVIAFTVPELFHKASATQLPVVVIQTANRTTEQQADGCVSTLHDLLQSGVDDIPSVDTKQDDTATLLYSSGTTGKSKGVVGTHRNHIAMVAGFMLTRDKIQNDTGEEKDVYLCIMPLFHVYGFFYTVSSVAKGNCMVVMPKFELVEMLRCIKRYRVTSVPAAPPLFVALTKSPVVAEYDLSSLRTIGSGGAPLGKEVIDEFITRFPNVEVRQGRKS